MNDKRNHQNLNNITNLGEKELRIIIIVGHSGVLFSSKINNVKTRFFRKKTQVKRGLKCGAKFTFRGLKLSVKE